jgi:hypothetical protein
VIGARRKVEITPPQCMLEVMRAVALVALAFAVGCATIPDAERYHEGCITIVNSSDGVQLYRNGHRVLGDDLEDATEASPAARTLAFRAKLHHGFGLGSLVLGGVMFAPGLGLVAYGGARQEAGAGAAGAVLTLTGIGGIVAGALLMTRARNEAGRAIDVYNEERHYCQH